MARITEKIKIYIYKHVDTGVLGYFTVALEHCPWFALVGTTETPIDFDESDLVDPHAAQLNKAEQELEAHRAESALKERQLLDKIDSLRALPHLESDHD